MEGDHPPALLTDVISADDDRRVLSPQARLRLIAAVGILCLLALVMAVADLVKDQRAQQRREAVAARKADGLTLAAQVLGIGSRLPTRSAVPTWTIDVMVYTRDSSSLELLSLALDGPWTMGEIAPRHRADARSATMMLTASCDAVARLQAPSSVQIRARHPGRRAVVVRVPIAGAALLERPRADCALALGPLGG